MGGEGKHLEDKNMLSQLFLFKKSKSISQKVFEKQKICSYTKNTLNLIETLKTSIYTPKNTPATITSIKKNFKFAKIHNFQTS